MRKLFPTLIALTLTLFCSCVPDAISEGRKAYKEYFHGILKDPESLVVYKEEIINQDEHGATFVLDTGAKNSFGAMVRQLYTIQTVGRSIVDVKEYDTRLLPPAKTEKKVVEKEVPFTYKEKYITTVVPVNNETFGGKTITLSDDILAAKDLYHLDAIVEAAQEDDNESFNTCLHIGAEIIRAGEKIKIDSCETHSEKKYFRIKYKGKSLLIQQTSAF